MYECVIVYMCVCLLWCCVVLFFGCAFALCLFCFCTFECVSMYVFVMVCCSVVGVCLLFECLSVCCVCSRFECLNV